MPLTQPSQGISQKDVTEWSKEPDRPSLTLIVEAVNEYVAGLPVVQHIEAGAKWPAEVRLGAIMLAARLAKRRNSPNGIEAATDMNVTYVARYDSDISRMLQLDRAAAPAVG